MINPVTFVLPMARDGLYESFYFRGSSADGRYAFWLKHNLLRYHGDDTVVVENALMLFVRGESRVRAVYDKAAFSAAEFGQRTASTHWEQFRCQLHEGSAFAIGRDRLTGELHSEGGRAAWALALTRSDEVLYHFPHERYYTLPWPKKKILTRDCRLRFQGRLQCEDLTIEGEFIGMNGHNWGTEHAWRYAYADCTRFTDVEEACFDGFSVQLALAGERIKTPYLSMASLKWAGQWIHFNSLLKAPRQEVNALTDYRWALTLNNKQHRLEVDCDGADPGRLPWVGLHYDHPGGKRSVVKNTKFAKLRLRLYAHDRHRPLVELTSDDAELETLLPDNRPTNAGYVGRA